MTAMRGYFHPLLRDLQGGLQAHLCISKLISLRSTSAPCPSCPSFPITTATIRGISASQVDSAPTEAQRMSRSSMRAWQRWLHARYVERRALIDSFHSIVQAITTQANLASPFRMSMPVHACPDSRPDKPDVLSASHHQPS